MYCAISGVVPEEPVISTKSGHVFEKRLIEKALDATNGRCPETGQELSRQDLIAIKPTGNVSRPVPPTATSLPGVLQHLQNEWDAVMLENHRLKMALNETRQELAHALYQYDAATRVIARLMKEKESAERNVQVAQDVEENVPKAAEQRATPAASKAEQEPQSNGVEDKNEQAADVEMESSEAVDVNLAADTVKQMVSKCQELQTKRKARVVPSELASQTQVGKFSLLSTISLDEKCAAVTSMDILDDVVYTGTSIGKIHSVDLNNMKVIGCAHKGHSDEKGGVTRICRSGGSGRRIISSGGDGFVKVWQAGEEEWRERDRFDGGDAVVDVATHPIESLLFCCYEKGKWLWRDIERGETVARQGDGRGYGGGYCSAAMHPDGMIFAVGRKDGIVQMWDPKSMKCVAQLGEKCSSDAGVVSIEMSDKGYYMASCVDGSISMWDLRKQQVSGEVMVDERKGRVAVSLDSTGSYGCGVGWERVVLFPAKKKAEAILRLNGGERSEEGGWARVGSVWGPNAQYLLTGSVDSSLRKFG